MLPRFTWPRVGAITQHLLSVSKMLRAFWKKTGGFPCVAQRSRNLWAVKYSEHGEPKNVLKLVEQEPVNNSTLGEKEVHVRMLMAPINPADINMAEGVYGISPPLPAFAGNEGVGSVEACGAGVTSLRPGDMVLPTEPASGTWRSEMIVNESGLLKVPSDIPVAQAATLTVNPATAYRMLRDFKDLQPGDVILQNGANSAVGLAVVQMAREMGVRTVNVVRGDRPDVERELRLLTNLGGDINIPDAMLGTAYLKSILSDLPPPRLAFNCVGGDSSLYLARTLGSGGVLVTYGGMSKRPVHLPVDLLTSKNLQLHGFWVSAWYKQCTMQQRVAMMDDICQMIRESKLTSFTVQHDIDDFDWALQQSQQPFQFRKVLLNLNPPNRLAEHDKLPEEAYWVFDTELR